MDITEFIAARLDEDEDGVRDLARGYPGPWSVDHSWVNDAAGNTVVHDEYHWSALPHIARHDPARVLREVAAKRAIIAAYSEACRVIAGWEHEQVREALRLAVRALAAVWSDHPDYRQEWAL